MTSGTRRSATLALVAVVLASSLTACKHKTSSESSPETSAPSAPKLATTAPKPKPAAKPTAALPRTCKPAPGYPAGTSTHHLTVKGLDRIFLVHLPPHPTAGMRLVVDFHGAGSDMYQQSAYSGFDSLADKHGFVVATPNGVDAAIRQWRYFSDDIDFAVAIVHELGLHACVDKAHAYATGLSSGAGMTATLECKAADTFAAFATVAANFYADALCGKARRRPIMIFHGTADPAVPYDGGRVGGSGIALAPAEETAAAWAKHNGCTAGPTRTRLGSQVVRLTWKGCTTPVVMYRIEGGGHTWPGSKFDVTRLGLTTHQISATNEMWKFFSTNA